MKKIAFSTGFFQRKYGDKRALEIARELGADAVDFSLIPCDRSDKNSIYSHSDDEIEAYYSSLREYAESVGIEIHQVHGRLGGYRDAEWNENMIENSRIDCLACAALGAKYCVAHTVTTGYWGPDCPPEEMHRMNDEMMIPMIEHAKRYGVILCTETFGDSRQHGCCDFFGNMDEFIKAYDRVASIGDNREHFKVCFDSGHTNNARRFNENPSVDGAIRMLGDRIAVLHLHDNNGLADQHKIVGCGIIDWTSALSALDEIGYDGVYNLEIELDYHFGKGFAEEETAFAIKAMRNMLK